MKKLYLLFISIAIFTTAGAQGVSRMFGLVGGYPQSDNSSNGFLFSTDSSGQNFQVQYPFPVTVSGALPANLEMMPYNGKLYGTTSTGGTGDFGTIFEYNPVTNSYTKKFDFGTNINANGGNPKGSLLLYNGKFYGCASSFGANFAGTIFEWDPATNIFTKKYDFVTAAGASPQNSLKLMNNKMYGTTASGGTSNVGVVFEWDPATNNYNKLLDMTGAGAGNGWSFYSNVTPYNNKIYCASYRGAANDAGALYVIDPSLPNGTNTTTIKVFGGASSSDGTTCNNNEMVVYNNKLYGTLYYNGAFSQGTLFELNPANNAFTKLVDFNYTTTGGNPLGKLVANGGKFLGLCSVGGANGTGTIYEWDPANPTTVVKKYDFGASNYDNPINPGSTLASFNSKFYAVSYYGGFNNQGALFEYDAATAAVTKKLNFNAAENGRIPYGRPTLLNGKIYGTCYTGPQPDAGCIWEYDPSTTVYSRKFNFDMSTGSGNGNHPVSAPVAYNGKLYGTTPSGGTSNYGVFYEFDPAANSYSKKDFQPIGGQGPIGEPTFYNGKFYGMTSANGAGNNGIIYSYDPATAVLAKLYDVQNSGSLVPSGGFTVYNNKLYGATLAGGGTGNNGGIIMYDPVANTASTVYALPASGLSGQSIQNTMTVFNNMLYGNCLAGGTGGRGVIFQFDPSNNNYTVLYHYNTTPGGNGFDPTGVLTLNGNNFFTITRDANTIKVVQLDPATNTVTTRSVHTPANNFNMPVYHNGLISAPAFIANGQANSCESYPSVTINASNNNQWVPVLNTAGDVVAELKANGNNLGTVTVTSYINNGTVREDVLRQMYLDRNLTITVQNQPSSNVDIRLYIKSSEFLALKNATNSQGQPSGISSISDIAILKNSDACVPAMNVTPIMLATSFENYEYGYVLKASVNAFSTFYFARNTFTALPVDIVSFFAEKQNERVLLHWNTENEINLQQYELERSTDGRTFIKIAATPAKGNNTNTYSIIDPSPASGINYYRLKSIDKNGSYRYSIVLKADFTKKYLVSILPNPAHDQITIIGATPFKKIQLVDMSGKTVKQLYKNNSNQYSLSGIAPGVYLLQLISDGAQQVEKIVIQ